MPKFDRKNLLTTRLSEPDLLKFRELAAKKKMAYSELLRDAVLFYIDHQDQADKDKIEGVYAQQLRASSQQMTDRIDAGVNRICALLAKNSVQTLAATKFLARLEDTEDMMKDCQGAAAKQINAQLTPEERETAQKIYRVVTKNVEP